MDSEIDAQDLDHDLQDDINGNVYVEGESDIIDEADEANNSFEQMRKTMQNKKKGNKSFDDFTEQVEN